MSQVWAVSALGGYLANPKLSRQIRNAATTQMRFRQFVRPEPGFGKNKGESILFNKIGKVNDTGGTLVETSRIPETDVSIAQGTVTVVERGNSIPYTGKLDDLSEFSVNNIWTVALRNDMAEVLDSAAYTAFALAKVKYTPTGSAGSPTGTFDTDGTISTAATRHVQTFDILEIGLYLKSTLKATKYDGENYMAVISPGFANSMMKDTDWKNASLYGDPDRLFAGEVKRFHGFRFVEETNVLDDTMGSTSYRGEAVFFGADPVVEGVAIPGEIRAKIPEDYGRSKGVAWYSILGFQIVWDTATARQANIVHLTST